MWGKCLHTVILYSIGRKKRKTKGVESRGGTVVQKWYRAEAGCLRDGLSSSIQQECVQSIIGGALTQQALARPPVGGGGRLC